MIKIVETGMKFETIGECAEYLHVQKRAVYSALSRPWSKCRGCHILRLDENGTETVDIYPKFHGITVLETGETFATVEELADDLGCDLKSLKWYLRGPMKGTFKGLHLKKIQKKGVMIVEDGRRFESVTDCAKALGTYQSNVSRALKDPGRTAAGYHIMLNLR